MFLRMRTIFAHAYKKRRRNGFWRVVAAVRLHQWGGGEETGGDGGTDRRDVSRSPMGIRAGARGRGPASTKCGQSRQVQRVGVQSGSHDVIFISPSYPQEPGGDAGLLQQVRQPGSQTGDLLLPASGGDTLSSSHRCRSGPQNWLSASCETSPVTAGQSWSLFPSLQIVDGVEITNMRTAAASACAARVSLSQPHTSTPSPLPPLPHRHC